MNIEDYQTAIAEFAIYEGAGTGSEGELMYLGLGLASEAGEAAGKIKKLYRDGMMYNEDLVMELGDVMWYSVMLCRAAGYSAADVLAMNYEKLSSRAQRNKISGNGDAR